MPERHAHVYAESIRRGGTMVTAKVDDAARASIEAIMDRHSPIDPDTRGAEYRDAGWKEFDPGAKPYQPDEAEIERMRRDYRN